MMISGQFIGILVLFFQLAASGQHPVAHSSYYACTYEEFFHRLPALYTIIDIRQPDYALLDAAIFHATNEARAAENLPPLKYSKALHQAAELHATHMIDLDFHSHYNEKIRYFYFPLDRIREFDKKIPLIAENIGEYPLMWSRETYCPERQKNGEFIYFNCKTHEPLEIHTYIGYAKMAVDKWMNSPPHRKNIVSPDYQYVGCAARFSNNPYKERKLPFARLTQNFGGYY
jgi:uncharacterized protein YkwD